MTEQQPEPRRHGLPMHQQNLQGSGSESGAGCALGCAIAAVIAVMLLVWSAVFAWRW